MVSVLVFCQSWRSDWNLTSFTLQCVTSLLGTVSDSKWFTYPTSQISHIRTPPTRDSCKLLIWPYHLYEIIFSFIYPIKKKWILLSVDKNPQPSPFLSINLLSLFLSGMRIQGSSGLWRNWRGVLFVRDFLFDPSSSFLSKGSHESSCWSRCVCVCAVSEKLKFHDMFYLLSFVSL